MNPTERFFINATKFFCLLIPVSLLIVAKSLLFPFITGKALLFRSLIELSALFLGLFVIHHPEYLPRLKNKESKDYLFWSSFLLLIVLVVLNFFSVRPNLSFWGNAERMEGIWSLFHFFLYLWVLLILFKIDPIFKKYLFWSFVIVGYLIGIQEIYEKFALKAVRPFATLGNSTYIGFFSLLLIYLCLYFYPEEKSQVNRAIIGILIVISFLSMLASETRGSIFALFVSIFVLALLLIFTSKLKASKKGLVAIGIVLAFLGLYAFVKSDLASKIPGFNRVKITLENPTSYKPRLISWRIFTNAFLTKPLIGYGLENSPVAYFDAFDAEMFRYEEAIFDRPHNKFIEILVTTGVIGSFFSLLFYLAILIHILQVQSSYHRSILIAFFVAYLAQNFTLFDMQASYLLFFFGLSLTATSIPLQRPVTTSHHLSLKVFLIGLTVIGLSINLHNFIVVRQIITNLKLQPAIALPNYDRLSQYAGPFLEEQSIILTDYFNNNKQKINKLYQLDIIKDILKKAHERNPEDIRIATNYTLFLSELAEAKKNQGMDASSEIEAADKVFQRTIKRFPRFPETYINYSTFLHNLKNDDQRAYELVQEAKKLYEKFPKGNIYIANNLSLLNRDTEALEFIDRALQTGFKPYDLRSGLMVLKIYLKNKRLDEANQLLAELLKNNPDPQSQQLIKAFFQIQSQ